MLTLYSFQELLFFLTCSASWRRPRRSTLSSGFSVTGSRLSQGSSPASQVTQLTRETQWPMEFCHPRDVSSPVFDTFRVQEFSQFMGFISLMRHELVLAANFGTII